MAGRGALPFLKSRNDALLTPCPFYLKKNSVTHSFQLCFSLVVAHIQCGLCCASFIVPFKGTFGFKWCPFSSVHRANYALFLQFAALKCPFDGPFTALKCPFQMAPCPFENLGRTLLMSFHLNISSKWNKPGVNRPLEETANPGTKVLHEKQSIFWGEVNVSV